MIEIKKSFIKDGEEKTHKMVSELSQMIYETYMNDKDTYKKILSECNISIDKLRGLVFGDLKDISLSEYNLIEAYLSFLNREILNKLYNLNTNDKSSNGCCKDTCENGSIVENFCKICDNCEHKQNVEQESDILKSEADSPDEKFIDNVNSTLEKKSQINKEEAINAKKQFDEDVNKNAASDYDNTAKKANVELFGTERDLNSMTMAELKYLLYKNHWDKEFDLNSINHRQTLLSFLYHKLEDRIIDKIHKKNNINKDSFDRLKNMYKEKYKYEYEGNAVKEILDVLDDINKMLG